MSGSFLQSMSQGAIALLLLAGVSYSLRAQEADSSAALFDDSLVHEFSLSFYTEAWQDSLTANYAADETYMPVRVTYRGQVYDSVGVRYKGNSSYVQSRATPKKPLKFKFDKYRSRQSFFGLMLLNFSNAVKDPTFVREKLAYDVLGKVLPSPRAAYAAIKVDGRLLGLYLMVEQVDKTFLRRHFTDAGFNLYKADDDGTTMEYRGADKEAYKREFELKTNEKSDDWSRFIAMLEILNNAPADSFTNAAGRLLDLGSSIQLLAFCMAVSNFDSYPGSGRNYYLYDDETSGRFVFIPWDLNEAFGAYSNDWDVLRQDALSIPNLQRRPLTRRILENDSLRNAYLRAIRAYVDGPASYDSIESAAARWKPFLDPYVRADSNKLYSHQMFLDNFERDVYVGVNLRIPGLLPFARVRGQNLRAQTDAYLPDGPPGAKDAFAGHWCYPNPAHGGSALHYRLRRGGVVGLQLFDSFGRETEYRNAGLKAPGAHQISGLGPDLPSGVYFYRLNLREADAVTTSASGKLVILQR